MFTIRRFSALALAAIALVAIGCGGSDDKSSSSSSTSDTTTAATTTAAASDTVGVKASEMKFVLTSDTAPAGKVTFNVDNVGSVDHEMVVIKTDTPSGDLPVKNGEVSEKGSIGEIGSDQLKPGKTVTKSFTMKPGHYALICALPGHYQAGMHSDFTVQ